MNNFRKTLKLLLLCMLIACAQKAFDIDKFKFDKQFIVFFKIISQNDTMIFENSKGEKRLIFLRNIDSNFSNWKGGVLSPRPYKDLSYTFIDSFKKNSLICKMLITKYPDNNETSLYFHFEKIFYLTDSFHHLKINTSNLLFKFPNNNNLYELSPKSYNSINVEDSMLINKIYFDSINGIVGINSGNNQLWQRIR